MYTVSIYKKHLTLSQRIKIEQGLNNNDSFRKITRDISKAHNTIAREVKNRRIKQKGSIEVVHEYTRRYISQRE